MTVAEAAAELGVGEDHLRRLLRRGDVAGIAFGGSTGWRLARDYVRDLARQLEAARAGKESARRTLGIKRATDPPKARVGQRKSPGRPRKA
jgi:excisionase family DNA binding protein